MPARARSRRPERAAGAGFSLIEVLVALAILGIGVGVVLQGLSQGLRIRRDSADTVRIAAVAEAALDEVAARDEAPRDKAEGESGDCSWTLTPQPVPAAREGDDPAKLARAPVPVLLVVKCPPDRQWEFWTLLPKPRAKK